uniref:Uncharacterized protein n=1 Tax=Eutreptiella gymnastica TaxID=73025 RepID=A0A7S4LKG6_9EUGL|mmetsp:Transcript_18146/g.28865  ORF Transcript_18146/g.28865 Transcript_18146/m.28865 type:complete len:208 (+) Transcript_18146:464-1087(+)
MGVCFGIFQFDLKRKFFSRWPLGFGEEVIVGAVHFFSPGHFGPNNQDTTDSLHRRICCEFILLASCLELGNVHPTRHVRVGQVVVIPWPLGGGALDEVGLIEKWTPLIFTSNAGVFFFLNLSGLNSTFFWPPTERGLGKTGPCYRSAFSGVRLKTKNNLWRLLGLTKWGVVVVCPFPSDSYESSSTSGALPFTESFSGLPPCCRVED